MICLRCSNKSMEGRSALEMEGRVPVMLAPAGIGRQEEWCGLLQVSVYDLGGGQQELAGDQGAKQQALLDDKKRTRGLIQPQVKNGFKP